MYQVSFLFGSALCHLAPPKITWKRYNSAAPASVAFYVLRGLSLSLSLGQNSALLLPVPNAVSKCLHLILYFSDRAGPELGGRYLIYRLFDLKGRAQLRARGPGQNWPLLVVGVELNVQTLDVIISIIVVKCTFAFAVMRFSTILALSSVLEVAHITVLISFDLIYNLNSTPYISHLTRNSSHSRVLPSTN